MCCATPADRIEGDDLVWELDLGRARGVAGRPARAVADPGWGWSSRSAGDIADVIHGRADDPLRRWLEDRPALRSDNAALQHTARQSRNDLRRCGSTWRSRASGSCCPAAGLPWFLTVFGRDTLITAYQTARRSGPQLAKGALLALARLQGETCDDFTDEEPGKILHEVRSGELTQLGDQAAQPVLRHRRRHPCSG